jgi:prepilin-type N-terminal cleavage/methylation domain-containing protein
MRKGFTLIELLIIIVIVAILGVVTCSNMTTTAITVDQNGSLTGNTTEQLTTVEVICPVNTLESVRDTVKNVRRFDYFDSHLSVYITVNGERARKQYPTNCIVRGVTDGF